ncbi:ABC transporter ATP-binding protein [Aquabacterium sp. OR-4]|uniref:ABC transporter ATP-binding protein n=1 Tax=Aquabacterium sp. OR-4 TaxID=2978127 RepID=UPI0028CA73A3|nr:ABC transporter ATP-binding protein [Aquabacterium sp. OR-4]MDT7839024.1 ABC transporter ATP-binding protein [Aquabacterium sp. OR-4]
MNANALLSIEGLSVAYGKIEAVSEVSLTLNAGEIVTVVGPNGAGKSTLLGAAMGVLPPRRGRICVAGEDLAAQGVGHRVARAVALVPETRALFASMNVEDNLRLGGYRLRGEAARTQAETLDWVYGLFPRLKERRAQQAATLSGGERQMLALGRALMGRPRLLMLDEPSLGLAPLIVRDIFRILGELRRQGVSILLVEQNARAALQLADRAYVLELGRVSMSGPADELARDPRIVEAYLGLHGQHQALLST